MAESAREFMDRLRAKADSERSESWDRWYATLPDDLKRRLSIYDFRRLGECFRQAFNIERVAPPSPSSDSPERK